MVRARAVLTISIVASLPPAARDDDVAGDVGDAQLAVGAELQRPGLPIGLLLAPLLVAAGPDDPGVARALDAVADDRRDPLGRGCADAGAAPRARSG